MPQFIPLAVMAVAAGVKMIKSAKQNKLANRVVVPEAAYKPSPFAKSMLDQANQMKNARMAGAASAEQNILGNQANTVGSIERNANSGAQALQMVSAAQGNTNNAFNTLQGHEGQYGLAMLNNWNNANMAMTEEDRMKYQADLYKRQEAINEKNSLRGAATQNFGSGMNDISNGIMSSYNAGAFNKKEAA